uniref:Uncharacterized protein n=1 Tax=Lotharella oceanica TaxID=641309 RepID=A0A7S2TGJ9_9EUKA|mmetsp:Transcript_10502/g.20155  ORF Transcript_10502/g.20155 Transcript_10502/m.20155 type:complete len:107 (+) Transcript_10502:325-645(+)
MISATYDLGVIACSTVVGYIGTYAHRPRILGYGACMLGLGCFIFAMPQITLGKYVSADSLRVANTFFCLSSSASLTGTFEYIAFADFFLGPKREETKCSNIISYMD